MTGETLTMLTEPMRAICPICGRPTELKDYYPHTAVCMACALESKAEGHRQASHWRAFEPS